MIARSSSVASLRTATTSEATLCQPGPGQGGGSLEAMCKRTRWPSITNQIEVPGASNTVTGARGCRGGECIAQPKSQTDCESEGCGVAEGTVGVMARGSLRRALEAPNTPLWMGSSAPDICPKSPHSRPATDLSELGTHSSEESLSGQSCSPLASRGRRQPML